MAENDKMSYQHEPLITPPNWGPDGRRLVMQMNNQLDILYSRFGRAITDLTKRVKELEDAANA